MSPGVLANMWKEEETKLKELEEKMASMLKDNKVRKSSDCLCQNKTSLFLC